MQNVNDSAQISGAHNILVEKTAPSSPHVVLLCDSDEMPCCCAGCARLAQNLLTKESPRFTFYSSLGRV